MTGSPIRDPRRPAISGRWRLPTTVLAVAVATGAGADLSGGPYRLESHLQAVPAAQGGPYRVAAAAGQPVTAPGAGSATALRSGFFTPLDVDSLFSDGFEGASP